MHAITAAAPRRLVRVDHLGQHRGVLVHDVVAQHHRERLVADVLAGDGDGVAEAEGLALAHVVDVGQVGEVEHLGEERVLALGVEVLLELDAAVEVVLDRLLAPPGDDEDVVDARSDRLLDHVLDGRLVDDRQHLLRLRLGGREEPGAQAGGGDDGLADVGHGAVLLADLRGQRALLASPEPLEVVAMAGHHQQAASREGRDLPGRSTRRHRRHREPRRDGQRSGGRRPHDLHGQEPEDGEAERRDRQEHGRHPGTRRDPLAAPEAPRGRRHVAEHGRQTAGHTDRPVPGGEAEGGGDGALGEVADQHGGSRAAAHGAKGVGCARVAGALDGGIAARAAAHHDRGGERPQEVGGDHEQPRQVHALTLRVGRVCGSGGTTATLALSTFEC